MQDFFAKIIFISKFSKHLNQLLIQGLINYNLSKNFETSIDLQKKSLAIICFKKNIFINACVIDGVNDYDGDNDDSRI